MLIREAQEGDAQAVAEVKRRSWQAAYRGLLPDDFLDDLPLMPPPEAVVEAIREGRAPLVSEDAGQIVGMAAAGTARGDDLPEGMGELFMIYTLEEVWGTGVGHALHEAAVERLRADGHEGAVLWVMAGNERAAGFYRAHGWGRDGVTRTLELGGVEVTEERFRCALGAD